MIDLITAAHRFQVLCQSLNWEFCFIGGIAVQHWGEPRLTRDVDATVFIGFGAEMDFVSTVLKEYEPRLTDAREFAQRHRVLLVRTTTGVDFDIALAALPFEEQMIRRSAGVEYLPGIELRICSAEDLIVLKCFASRPQDWRDVSSIIVRQGSANLDWDYIVSNLEPLVAVKEEPQILQTLDSLRRTAAD